jgi:hypothetical protein
METGEKEKIREAVRERYGKRPRSLLLHALNPHCPNDSHGILLFWRTRSVSGKHVCRNWIHK